MDKDHASARKGLERDTQSLGWFSKFVASAKGLFGLLKLTKKGREMIEGREYRHVSPVFALNQDKEPIRLLSVAATNTPAIRVPENVILNAEPEQSNSEVLHMDITKEELVELIKSTVTTMNAEPSTTEEVVVNQGDSVSLNQGNEPTKPNEPACNETPKEDESKEEKTEEKTEETPKEEPEKKVVSTEVETSKTEEETPKTEPEKKDEPETKDSAKAEEVIKEEVLNSAPTTTVPKVEEEWRNLTGKDLSKWIAEHRDAVMEYQRNWYSTH